ncbi:uncharacterized protein N7487_000325 [Penicillium crustosum]|uniref:uncharacterized protein n=1 Tax=Penicillium crustosum TaxID=36656 RepID=UPI00239CF4BF|nr:uncharacterized protein N7487_000325 [Penicillium crustosum]KAJ5416775.1 hypothetical protein N7487_000325 [Penicillium crustosum]
MDVVLLDFFFDFILNTRARCVQAVVLAPDNDLFDLMQRIHSLHCDRDGKRHLSPLSISDAVHIWQDLDDWDPAETELINEDDNLYESYKFALFIWTYIIVHPAEVGGEKVQDALHHAISNISEVEDPDLMPLVIIPLFFSGLAAIQRVDRDLVNEQYQRVESYTEHGSIARSRSIVQSSWEKHDNGMKQSWDWRRWGDSSLIGS